MHVLTLEKTNESATTRREEIAPVILSTRSWVSVRVSGSALSHRSHLCTYREASSAKEHAMARLPTVLKIIP
jgi:hypothetical protein